MFRDSLEISEKHLKELIGLIEQRERILRDNLDKILDDQVKWENKLLLISEDEFGSDSENPEVISIEKEIMKLERDKRQEEVSFWQDVSRLRLMIAEAMREKKAEERKIGILSEGGNGLSQNPDSGRDNTQKVSESYIINVLDNYESTG